MKNKIFTKKAFTLIELLVVVAIIGILATVVVVNLTNAQKKSRIAKTRSDLSEISKASDLLFLDTGQRMFHYNANWSASCTRAGAVMTCAADGNTEFSIDPDKHSGLIQDDTTTSTTSGLTVTAVPYPNWNGPYLPAQPKDPWGIKYYFDPDFRCGPSVNGCEGRGTASIRAIQSLGPDNGIDYGWDVFRNVEIISDDLVIELR